MRRLIPFVLLAALASLAARTSAQTEEIATAEAGLSYFATIGEGLTSADRQTGITAAYRMFSVPTFDQHCRGSPTRLVAPEGRLTLRAGSRYALTRLVIVAEGAAGTVIPGVPIGLEAEAKTPPVVLLTNDALADGELSLVAPGRFRLRARTLCPGTGATAVVDVSVVGE